MPLTRLLNGFCPNFSFAFQQTSAGSLTFNWPVRLILGLNKTSSRKAKLFHDHDIHNGELELITASLSLREVHVYIPYIHMYVVNIPEAR
jgi:hypothetical protein